MICKCWITYLLTISVISAFPANEVSQSQEQRIKGGHDAEIGAYPWQISLANRRSGNYYHGCGGSIIGKQWVLTAAHCVHPNVVPPTQYAVIAGAHDLARPNKNQQFIQVIKVIQHENYTIEVGNNDVALVKVASSFQFNDFVSPIRLAVPEQEEFIEGNNKTYCVTSGWGRLKLNGSIPTILQAVDMPLVPLQICKDSYGATKEEYEVTDDMLCTGHMKGDKSPCHGDSGGPLACLIKSKWTLTGVVSWGKNCGYPDYPALYARVTYFHDWIQKNMAKN